MPAYTTARARPSATSLLPYRAVRLRLQLAEVHLAIADVATVHRLLREIIYSMTQSAQETGKEPAAHSTGAAPRWSAPTGTPLGQACRRPRYWRKTRSSMRRTNPTTRW
jgi:hypothetical protein